MDINEVGPALLVGAVLGALIAAVLVMCTVEHPDELKREAVLKGKAEWYAHPATGEVQWRWKP